MGAQGLRCLKRYPSLLPGLAVAKTRTHHRDGTGYWGREMSQAGIKREGQGSSEGKERAREKGRLGQGQRERWGSREKKKRKQKNDKAWKCLEKRERREEGSTLTQPFPSAAPFPVVQGRNG